MKKFYNLKMMLLVALLSLVGVNANAQEAKMTFEQTSATAGTLTGAPEGVTATFKNTYKSNKIQLTSGKKMTLTIKGLSADYTVSGISVHVHTNEAKGKGSVTATLGGTTIGTLSITPMGKAWQRKSLNVTPTIAGADLVIEIKATQNSVYCDEFVITYSKKEKSVSVNIGATGYSTLYYSDRALVVPENVYAYTYKVTNGKLDESYLYNAGETIPAATGVVLKAAPGEYTFAASEENGEEDTDNLLKGSDEAALTTGGAVYYKLSLNKAGDANSVGFYYGAADGAAFTNGAHKAYLALPAASGVRAFLFNEGTITGIQNATTNSAAMQVYDLQGRRVQSAQKGLYIINGKKVLVK